MTDLKYTGILVNNMLKITKEKELLLNKKMELEQRIQTALGVGFDISEYENELNTIIVKLKIYNKIFI